MFPLTDFNNEDEHATKLHNSSIPVLVLDRGLRRRVACRAVERATAQASAVRSCLPDRGGSMRRRDGRVSESVGARHHGVRRRHRHQRSGQRHQFSLSGVPRGPLSLRFTGNGMDSELGLAPVRGHRGHRPHRQRRRIDRHTRVGAAQLRQGDSARGTASRVCLRRRRSARSIVAGQLVTTTPATQILLPR